MRLLSAGWVLMFCATASAADGWVSELPLGRIVLRSEFASQTGKQNPNLNEVSEGVEALKADLEQTLRLRFPDSNDPAIEINIFKSHRNYRRYLGQRVPEAATREASFVQGTDLGRVYVVYDKGFQRNLHHESTHALLHQALPFVPIWLDEGLAVYFESPAAKRADGGPHLSRIRWATKLGWQPDLEELEKRETLTDMKPADYRHAWAWTHFLLHESDESRQLLVDYLAEIQSGIPPGPLSLRIRDRMPNASQRIVKHLESWR